MVSRRGTLAFAQQGHMHANKIGLTQRFVHTHILDPILGSGNTPRLPQIHNFLNGIHILVILIGRVIAENIHIEPGAFLDHRQPNPPGPDNGDRLPGHFVAKKRQVGVPVSHLFSRVRCSAVHSFRVSAPIMKNANSAVASVSTSAVWVKGILYRLASVRLMLSKPTAICATTFSFPLPASNTSASIWSRSVVINPSTPDF